MPDNPLSHRELADLNLKRANSGAGLTDYATTASLHYLAHIAGIAEEIRDHVAFLASPDAARARDEAELAKPDPATAYAPVLTLPMRDDRKDRR